MFLTKKIDSKKIQTESNRYNLKKMGITTINLQNHKFQNLQLLNLQHLSKFLFFEVFFFHFKIFLDFIRGHSVLVQFAWENPSEMKNKLILKICSIATFTVLLKIIFMFSVLFYCEHDKSFIEMLV